MLIQRASKYYHGVDQPSKGCDCDLSLVADGNGIVGSARE